MMGLLLLLLLLLTHCSGYFRKDLKCSCALFREESHCIKKIYKDCFFFPIIRRRLRVRISISVIALHVLHFVRDARIPFYIYIDTEELYRIRGPNLFHLYDKYEIF